MDVRERWSFNDAETGALKLIFEIGGGGGRWGVPG